MSGFENYGRELDELDREIRRHAAACGVNLGLRHEVEACLNETADSPATTEARQSLRGLLLLRMKVETEMMEQGQVAPPLLPTLPGA